MGLIPYPLRPVFWPHGPFGTLERSRRSMLKKLIAELTEPTENR